MVIPINPLHRYHHFAIPHSRKSVLPEQWPPQFYRLQTNRKRGETFVRLLVPPLVRQYKSSSPCHWFRCCLANSLVAQRECTWRKTHRGWTATTILHSQRPTMHRPIRDTGLQSL